MKKTVFFYSLVLAALIFLLKMLEYRFVIRDLSLEFYIGVIAVLFTLLGMWAGLRLTRKKNHTTIPDATFFIPDEQRIHQLGISKREREVLALMAQGCSNQEIASRLFVSVSTIKTHTSNLFIKLDAKRRTQAIQRAKELKILP
jgi:two-component system, NarL family, response regulator LiaR